MSEEENTPEVQSEELSVEDRAKQLGWHPAEEYRGDPEKHLSAEEFVAKGENELPVLRSNIKKIQSDLKKQQDEFQRTATEFRQWHETTVQKAEREAYERAKADIERKKIEAVETADTDAYQRAAKEEANLKPPTPPAAQPQSNPQYEAWVAQNQWFNEYPELALEAENLGVKLWNSGSYKPEQVYEKITESMKRKYPHYFKNPKKDEVLSVNEGTEAPAGRRGKSKNYDNLPKSAKEACDRFIRLGMISNKDEYVKSYEWE